VYSIYVNIRKSFIISQFPEKKLTRFLTFISVFFLSSLNEVIAVECAISYAADTTITSDCDGFTFEGDLNWDLTINSGININDTSYVFDNNRGHSITGDIINNGIINASGSYLFRNNGGSFESFTNNSTIQIDGSYGLYNQNGVFNNFTNNSTITIGGSYAIYNFSSGGGNSQFGTLTNSGTISVSGSYAIYNNDSSSTFGSIINSGIISSSRAAVYINSGSLDTITNTGTITGSLYDIGINTSASFVTLNNLQGGDDALKYDGELPVNYNIIINSASEYGSVEFTNASSNFNFGINTNYSTASLSGYYTNIFSGLSSSNFSATTGTVNSSYWSLFNPDGDDIWDLIISYSGDQTISDAISTSDTSAHGVWMKENDASTISITGDIITSGTAAHGLYMQSSDSNTMTLSNSITTSGASAYAVNIDSSSTSNSFTLSGSISGGFYNAASNTTITNSGTIDSLINTGNISTLTNTGTISALTNSGAISTFENDYASVDFTGTLPSNYNIIINSTSDYGKVNFLTATGAMTFGITSDSSVTESQTYSGVLDGITASNLNSTSGTFTNSSNSQTYNWTLSNSSANLWDLVFSSCTNCYPSTASTQSTINNISYGMTSQMASFAMTTNFANLNTYDCGLFDAKGGCFSVGGRFTDVNANNNSDSDSSAIVMVGGYKINDHVRIAGFADQMVNNNTPSGIDMENKSPMVGLSLVWNQHPDHLGYQVKLANAYQDKDVTISRTATGDAEAGSGSTDVSVQSYIAEVSYQFLSNDKTAYQPYFAGRYAKIKQDGYTETNVDNPLTYSTIEDESVTLIMGMKVKHALSPEIYLNGSLAVEHDIHNDVDNLSVTATNISGLTPVSVNSNINKTRGVASLGADYYLAKNQMLSLKTQFQELAYTNTNAKTAYLSYTIGF